MGDISAEPSMEEILSSIKRIIAEEGDAPPARARKAPARAAAPQPLSHAGPAPQAPAPVASAFAPEPEDDEPEVLELNDPMPAHRTRPAAPAPAAPSSAAAPAESILSREAAEATRGSLDVLSRLVTKPEPGSDGTLEGLVREMLRPMLREWMDTNLPAMVEHMVAREIAKITGQAG